MLKNEELINKLTKEEKVKYLYNLSKINENEELPSFNLKRISELEGKNFKFDLENLLYSWNENLLDDYGQYVSSKALNNGNNLILTERISHLVSNHEDDNVITCEDPLLLGTMLSSFYSGVKDHVNLVLDYDLDEKDINYIQESPRILDGFFLSSLNEIANNVEPDYILLSSNKDYSKYTIQKSESLYSHLLKHEYKGEIISDIYSEKAPYNINGYSLKNDVNLNPDDFDENELDIKLDNLLSKLMLASNNDEENKENKEFFNRSIYSETSVLLKNKNQVLPLTSYSNLFVLGNVDNLTNTIIKEEYPNLNLKVYLRKSLNKKSLNVKTISKMISNTDTMLLILNGKNLNLDVKKIENIILKCKKANRRIILFTTDFNNVRYDFVKYVDSIIFNTKYDAKSLFDLIAGKLNPSGRLTSSNESRNLVSIRMSLYKKIGDLIGYRYYDTNNENPKYPFGYGLSYSKFTYSNISITSEHVILTVYNASSIAGSDILQVYIGANNSKLIRPKRELKAFKKVFLKPGERKQIAIEIPKDAYNFYSKENDDFDVEAQMYSIYLASSFDDIISQENIYVDGNKKVAKEEGKLEDYLVKPSNKVDDRYKFKNNRKALNTKIFTAILVVLFLAIIGFEVWNDVIDYDNVFALIISSILIVLAFVFVIILLVRYNKLKKFENYQEIDNAIPVTSIDDMFDDYEDNYAETYNNTETHEEEELVEESIIEKFNDNSLKEYIDDFSTFLLANGLKLDEDNLKLYIASLASNKLIFIKNDNKELVNKLICLTNLYLNGSDYQDYGLVINPASTKELLVSINENNEEMSSSFKKIVDNANQVRNKIYLTYVQLDGKDVPVTFLNDLNTFYENRNSSFNFEFEESLINLPRNLWTIISIDKDYSIDQIDPDIIKNAVVLPLDINEIENQKPKKQYLELTYQEFIELVRACKNDYYINELNYKKIDEIQKFVNSKNDYEVNTKINYSIEDFLAILLYLKDQELDALDELFAYKIIPLSKTLLADVEEEDVTLEEKIEKLLDENHQEHSLKMI